MYLKLKGFQGFKLSNCLLFKDFHLFKENKWFLKDFLLNRAHRALYV